MIKPSKRMKRVLLVSALLTSFISAPSLAQAQACITKPVNCRVSSPFGYRVHPVTGQLKLHRGIDFACPVGTPVGAAHTGSVTGSFFDHGGGNTIKVRTGTLETKYLHNHSFLTSSGASVSGGQAIARSGNTGAWTTGPHLHFEAWQGASPVDPNTLFCDGPAPVPGVLDGVGDTDPTMIAHHGAVDQSKVIGPTMTGLDGSQMGIVANIISARTLNPDYVNQLAQLSEERLYGELAYIEAASLYIKMLTEKSKDRIIAAQSVLNTIKAKKIESQLQQHRIKSSQAKQ